MTYTVHPVYYHKHTQGDAISDKLTSYTAAARQVDQRYLCSSWLRLHAQVFCLLWLPAQSLFSALAHKDVVACASRLLVSGAGLSKVHIQSQLNTSSSLMIHPGQDDKVFKMGYPGLVLQLLLDTADICKLCLQLD